jgi:hypothetical protein
VRKKIRESIGDMDGQSDEIDRRISARVVSLLATLILMSVIVSGCCSKKPEAKEDEKYFKIAGVKIGATMKAEFLAQCPDAKSGEPKKGNETFTTPVDLTIEEVRFNLMGATFQKGRLVEVTLYSRVGEKDFAKKFEEISDKFARRYDLTRQDYSSKQAIFQVRKNVYPMLVAIEKDGLVVLSFVEIGYWAETHK